MNCYSVSVDVGTINLTVVGLVELKRRTSQITLKSEPFVSHSATSPFLLTVLQVKVPETRIGAHS